MLVSIQLGKAYTMRGDGTVCGKGPCSARSGRRPDRLGSTSGPGGGGILLRYARGDHRYGSLPAVGLPSGTHRSLTCGLRKNPSQRDLARTGRRRGGPSVTQPVERLSMTLLWGVLANPDLAEHVLQRNRGERTLRMDVERDILRGFKAEVVGRVLYFATTGVVILFLARYLSPAAYGVIFLALSLLAVGQLGANLGIPRSAARFVTEYETRDPDTVGFIVAFSFVTVLAAATTVAVLMAALHGQIAALFGEPALGPLLLVGGGMILCRALYEFFRRVLQGFKSVGLSASVYSVEGVGRLVFVVGFVLLGFGTVGAIGGYALGYASAAVLGAVLFYRYVYPDLQVTLDGDRTARDRIVNYAMPLLGIRSARVADTSLDTILVGLFLSPAMVGFYSLSRQAIHLLQAPASALGFSAGPWFGEQKTAGNVDRIGSIYTSSLTYTLLLYVPIAAGLVLLARPMIQVVFGEGYLPATVVLQVFSAMAVLRAVETLSENVIDYLGRARIRFVAKAVTVTGSLAAMVVLIPALDIVGAALARVVSHAVYVGTLLVVMYDEVDFDARAVGHNLALVLGVTTVMSGAVLYAAPYITGVVTLAAVVGLGAAIWGTSVVALGIVDVSSMWSHLR